VLPVTIIKINIKNFNIRIIYECSFHGLNLHKLHTVNVVTIVNKITTVKG